MENAGPPLTDSEAKSHVLYKPRAILRKVLCNFCVFFMLNLCFYITRTQIRCLVEVLTLQELQIPPHFDTYLTINKYITILTL